MFDSYNTKEVQKVIESYHCFLAKGINEKNIFMSVGKHFFDENRVLISTIRPPETVTYNN